MSTRASKLSQLNPASAIGPADLLYVVQSGNSMSVNAAVAFGKLSFTTGPFEGNTTVAAVSAANTKWFSFLANTYAGAKILVHAYDATANMRSVGEIFVVTSNSSANQASVVSTIGDINLGITPNIASGNVTLYFARTGAETSNILFRYSVLYINP